MTTKAQILSREIAHPYLTQTAPLSPSADRSEIFSQVPTYRQRAGAPFRPKRNLHPSPDLSPARLAPKTHHFSPIFLNFSTYPSNFSHTFLRIRTYPAFFTRLFGPPDRPYTPNFHRPPRRIRPLLPSPFRPKSRSIGSAAGAKEPPFFAHFPELFAQSSEFFAHFSQNSHLSGVFDMPFRPPRPPKFPTLPHSTRTQKLHFHPQNITPDNAEKLDASRRLLSNSLTMAWQPAAHCCKNAGLTHLLRINYENPENSQPRQQTRPGAIQCRRAHVDPGRPPTQNIDCRGLHHRRPRHLGFLIQVAVGGLFHL